MSQAVKIIADAFDIIKDPNKWTQIFYYRNKYGEICNVEEGVKFCALGGLHAAASYVKSDTCDQLHQPICILQEISQEFFGKNIQEVNDDDEVPREVAHANVLRVYQTALERYK